MRAFTVVPLGAAALLAAAAVHAEVTATAAWVEAAASKGGVSGVYLTLTSTESTFLVGASSPAAGIVEVQRPVRVGAVLAMRSVDDVALPAGRAVTLAPGGEQVKLIELVAPLAKGQSVPVTLRFMDAHGRRASLEVRAEVREALPVPRR